MLTHIYLYGSIETFKRLFMLHPEGPGYVYREKPGDLTIEKEIAVLVRLPGACQQGVT